MNNRSNLSESFEKFVDSTFEKIDGVLVQKAYNETDGRPGYMWGREWFATKEQIQNAMKGIYMTIPLRIVNPNGEVKKLGSEYTDHYLNGRSAYNEYKKDQS